MSIQINNTELRIRPSAIDSFQQCSYQWAKVFLEGIPSIPNSRAALGTAIHKAVEVMWLEAIEHNEKDPNIDVMVDAGVESFKETANDVQYDKDEDINTINKEIVLGTNAFVDDCLPFLDIPEATETRFTMKITDHPLVKELSGTVDYIAPGRIDDLKTSKRTPQPSSYTTQQTIYKLLAEHNGHKIDRNMIQGVILTKKPKGVILELEPDVPRAKALVNNMLDVLHVAANDMVPLDVLFRCNTKYYLCSRKYCNFYGSCPATKGA